MNVLALHLPKKQPELLEPGLLHVEDGKDE